jgi:DNA-binding IclR family transcriptional regulator
MTINRDSDETRRGSARKATSERPAKDGVEGKSESGRRRGIDRVVEVLELLYQRNEPMRPNQIAAAMGAPRSTIYDIIDRLRDFGLIENFDDEGRVFLGRRLHYFGTAYVKRVDLMREADLTLRRLTERTNETSQFCLMEGDKYTIALMRHGGHHFRISADIGQAVPIPWTASGPLLVSHLSDEEILSVIPDADFTLPDGRRLEPEAFLRRAHMARKRGFSRHDGQLDTFTHCLAAPVMDAEQRCIATLCLVLPRADAEKRGDELMRILTDAAATLSERLGGVIGADKPLRVAMSRG